VNGAEVPKTYVDPVSGTLFPQGMIVAFKRSLVNNDMEDPVADRIRAMFNELITMQHPPLSAHPNIVNLLGLVHAQSSPGLNCPSTALGAGLPESPMNENH
jgi:hypothetical protein